MKKLLLFIGFILLVVGTGLFIVGATYKNEEEILTNEFIIEESFNDFDISLKESSLEFKEATDGKTKVVVKETEKMPHSAEVVDNTLKITQLDNYEWYEKIFSFSIRKLEVVIYLTTTDFNKLTVNAATGDITIPDSYKFTDVNISLSTGDIDFKASTTNELKIKLSTGDIKLQEVNPNTLNLSSSTGSIYVKNVNVTNDAVISSSTGNSNLENFNALNLNISTSTGNSTLTNTIITNNLIIENHTGNIKLNEVDAATITATSHTGNITGIILSNKDIHAESATGNVDVPNNNKEGNCTLSTGTGNIKITFK